MGLIRKAKDYIAEKASDYKDSVDEANLSGQRYGYNQPRREGLAYKAGAAYQDYIGGPLRRRGYREGEVPPYRAQKPWLRQAEKAPLSRNEAIEADVRDTIARKAELQHKRNQVTQAYAHTQEERAELVQRLHRAELDKKGRTQAELSDAEEKERRDAEAERKLDMDTKKANADMMKANAQLARANRDKALNRGKYRGALPGDGAGDWSFGGYNPSNMDMFGREGGDGLGAPQVNMFGGPLGAPSGLGFGGMDTDLFGRPRTGEPMGMDFSMFGADGNGKGVGGLDLSGFALGGANGNGSGLSGGLGFDLGNLGLSVDHMAGFSPASWTPSGRGFGMDYKAVANPFHIGGFDVGGMTSKSNSFGLSGMRMGFEDTMMGFKSIGMGGLGKSKGFGLNFDIFKW